MHESKYCTMPNTSRRKSDEQNKTERLKEQYHSFSLGVYHGKFNNITSDIYSSNLKNVDVFTVPSKLDRLHEIGAQLNIDLGIDGTYLSKLSLQTKKMEGISPSSMPSLTSSNWDTSDHVESYHSPSHHKAARVFRTEQHKIALTGC